MYGLHLLVCLNRSDKKLWAIEINILIILGNIIMPSVTDFRRLITQLSGEIKLLRGRSETARLHAIKTGSWNEHNRLNAEISKRNTLISELKLKILIEELTEAKHYAEYYKKIKSIRRFYWNQKLKSLRKQLSNIKPAIEGQITTLNDNALIAHENMQAALSNGEHLDATAYRKDRDHFNRESAKLADALIKAVKIALVDSAPSNVSRFSSAKVADDFRRNHNQDMAHRAIFKELLEGKYSTERTKNHPDKKAFDAIRKNILAPLFFINNNIQVDNYYRKALPVDENDKQKFSAPQLKISEKRKFSSYFIRDFMGIRSRGNLRLNNWLIEDTVLDSEFASDFDDLVVDINAHLTPNAVRKFKDVAHRDVIQLIPAPNESGSDQMAGAVMSDIEITNNIIQSQAQLNGIFGSDGAFRNLNIVNNHIETKGEHTISINGMLSGEIKDNTDTQGRPLKAKKIKLLPLRIGGGANIYIIGFNNKPTTPYDEVYEYKEISGVPKNDCANTSISAREQYGDMRTCIRGSYAASTPGASFYDKVDMQEFHKEYAKRDIVKKGRKKKDYVAVMEKLVSNGYAVKVI